MSRKEGSNPIVELHACEGHLDGQLPCLNLTLYHYHWPDPDEPDGKAYAWLCALCAQDLLGGAPPPTPTLSVTSRCWN